MCCHEGKICTYSYVTFLNYVGKPLHIGFKGMEQAVI